MRNKALELRRLDAALGVLDQHSRVWETAPWLKVDFRASVWPLEVGQDTQLDFRVKLEDGSALTDSKNSNLELTIKRFLIAQTHPEKTGGILYTNETLTNLLDPAIRICEYILVRAEEFGLAEFGLSAISESMCYRLLRSLSEREAAEAVFEWSTRLSELLRREGAALTKNDLAVIQAERPETLLAKPCKGLSLTLDETARARAWLWQSGLYRQATTSKGSAWIPDSSRLLSILYPRGMLRSTWARPQFDELALDSPPNLVREMPGSPVRAESRSIGAVQQYLRPLRALPLVERSGLFVPAGLIKASSDQAFLKQLEVSSIGRYRSLPHELVLASLRNALEFALQFGEPLIDAYLELARISVSTGNGLVMCSRSPNAFSGGWSESVGVKHWSLSYEFLRAHRAERLDNEAAAKAFFVRMRSNEGLYELLEVLWGAVLVATGALMARRQGDILSVKAGAFLDESGTRLSFEGRKRNALQHRQILKRPLPPVLAKLLKLLVRLQDGLVSMGVLQHRTLLFAFPKFKSVGLVPPHSTRCNQLLDRFCDYFEVKLDVEGRRHYLRHHQLRRFFALLFFWGNSYAGLETLRWFLGHTDPEHLYRYITESMSGEALREAKVDYVLDQLRANHPSADGVAGILEQRFGANYVQLMDARELEDYLGYLLREGKVQVEPHFFTGHSGREYIILITVSEA